MRQGVKSSASLELRFADSEQSSRRQLMQTIDKLAKLHIKCESKLFRGNLGRFRIRDIERPFVNMEGISDQELDTVRFSVTDSAAGACDIDGSGPGITESALAPSFSAASISIASLHIEGFETGGARPNTAEYVDKLRKSLIPRTSNARTVEATTVLSDKHNQRKTQT